MIGNLSVIVGAGRRGEIVIREGDDLKLLVKNFIQLYGLKRDTFPTILGSLEELVRKSKPSTGRSKSPITPPDFSSASSILHSNFDVDRGSPDAPAFNQNFNQLNRNGPLPAIMRSMDDVSSRMPKLTGSNPFDNI